MTNSGQFAVRLQGWAAGRENNQFVVEIRTAALEGGVAPKVQPRAAQVGIIAKPGAPHGAGLEKSDRQRLVGEPAATWRATAESQHELEGSDGDLVVAAGDVKPGVSSGCPAVGELQRGTFIPFTLPSQHPPSIVMPQRRSERARESTSA